MVSPYIPYYVGGGAAVNPEKPTEKKKEDPTSTIPAYTGQNTQSPMSPLQSLMYFAQAANPNNVWGNLWSNISGIPGNVATGVSRFGPSAYNQLTGQTFAANPNQAGANSNTISQYFVANNPNQMAANQNTISQYSGPGAVVQQTGAGGYGSTPAQYQQYQPYPAYQPGQAPMGTTWWAQPGYSQYTNAGYDANAQYQYYSQMAAAKPAGAPKPVVKPQVQAAYGGYSQPVYYGGGGGGGGGYSYSSPATPKRNVVEGVSWRI